jgi:hypothetical protein
MLKWAAKPQLFSIAPATRHGEQALGRLWSSESVDSLAPALSPSPLGFCDLCRPTPVGSIREQAGRSTHMIDIIRVAYAAETGGADAGFWVAAITSGRKVSSRGVGNFDSGFG